MHLRVSLYLVLLTCHLGCMINDTRSGKDSTTIDLNKLPQSLEDLQSATGHQDWEILRGYSRSLTHFRQVRFQPGANVFISETGSAVGQVDVVEVILIPREPNAAAEFALYDPETGKRIINYPESVQFAVEGIHGDSKNPAPGLCHACHAHTAPLNAFVPWTQSLEQRLERARTAGQGIRADLFVTESPNQEARDQVERLNTIMKDQFPDRVSDVREWMRPVPTTESSTRKK